MSAATGDSTEESDSVGPQPSTRAVELLLRSRRSIIALSRELEEERQRRGDVEARLEDMQRFNQSQLSERISDSSRAQHHFGELTRSNEDLQNTLEQTKKLLAQAVAECGERDDRIKILQDKVRTVSLDGGVGGDAGSDELRGSLSAAKAEVKQLREELESWKKVGDSAEPESGPSSAAAADLLRGIVPSLESRLEVLRGQLVKKIESCELSLARTQRKSARLRGALARKLAEYEEMKRKNGEVFELQRADIRRLRQMVARAEERASTATSQLQQTIGALKRAHEKLRKLSERPKVGEAEARLRQQVKHLKETMLYSVELHNMEQRSLQAKRDDCLRENQALSDEVRAYKESLDNAMTSTAEAKVEYLAELARLKAKLKACRQRYEALKDESELRERIAKSQAEDSTARIRDELLRRVRSLRDKVDAVLASTSRRRPAVVARGGATNARESIRRYQQRVAEWQGQLVRRLGEVLRQVRSLRARWLSGRRVGRARV